MNCLTCNQPLTKHYQKKYCSNKCKLSSNFYQTRKKPAKNTESKVAVCRVDGWIGKDYQNLSGNLTKHLIKLGISTSDPLSYYLIQAIQEPQLRSCPACSFTSKDLSNKSGRWTKHIVNDHNTTVADFIQHHPQVADLFYHQSSLITHQTKIKDPNNQVSCSECGQLMEKITETHCKLHGLTVNQYKTKYPQATIISPYLSQQISTRTSALNKTRQFTRRSQAEIELELLINNLNIKTIPCDRSLGFEVDIMIPEHKLAIEYNGLLYHSEGYGKKGRSYHLQKTKLASQAGIQLMHIFEDEWQYNRQLVLNRIYAKLGVTDNHRISARQCQVVPITRSDGRLFLQQNHLQSADRSQIYYGLLYKQQLVAVMSFNSLRRSLGHRGDKQSVWELVRYATNRQVVGGASKLLAAFAKQHHPKTIISYADRRYTNQNHNLYQACQFELIATTAPSYWYTKDYKHRLHRYGFTKSRLVSKFGANANLTEWENMQLLGYDRVWDCGSFKYQKTYL